MLYVLIYIFIKKGQHFIEINSLATIAQKTWHQRCILSTFTHFHTMSSTFIHFSTWMDELGWMGWKSLDASLLKVCRFNLHVYQKVQRNRQLEGGFPQWSTWTRCRWIYGKLKWKWDESKIFAKVMKIFVNLTVLT